MAKIVLVTGGCRSGKSRYAQEYAESLVGERLYLATCTIHDEEMRQRVEKHKQERMGRGWKTAEEPRDLVDALSSAKEEVVLIDCLTLWVSNLMFHS